MIYEGVGCNAIADAPRVYVRIGQTADSPMFGLKLRSGRSLDAAKEALVRIENTEMAIQRYMGILGSYMSVLYHSYVNNDTEASQLLSKMSSNNLGICALLLERLVHSINPSSTPVLAVELIEKGKAPIKGYTINTLINPEACLEWHEATLGDLGDLEVN